LSLDNLDINENSAAGTTVGTLTGMTTGSTLSLTDSAGARFALDGNDIEAGATLTDYGTATAHDITVRETLVGSDNSPRDSVFTITVNNAAPVLSNLVVTPIGPGYTTASISVDTNDAGGTMYFVVITSAAATPNAAQIAAGTDGDDDPATWADNVAVSSIDTYTGGPTGLTPDAVYDCYVVQYDGEAVASNVVSIDFTQAAGAATRQYMLGDLIPVYINEEGAAREYMHGTTYVNGA
jgi:hypothetical protein